MIRRWPIRIRLTVAFAVMMGLALAAVGAVTVAHTKMKKRTERASVK